MNKELIEKVDLKLNIMDLFDNNVFSVCDVGGKSKPDPAIFLYSAEKLGVFP